MAYNRQQQHSRETYRSYEPLQYHRNAFLGNNMVKQGSRSIFGFHLHGFSGFREPVEDVSRDGMDFNWKHQHSRVHWGHLNPYSTLGIWLGGITGWNRGPEAFLGSMYIVTEASQSQLKMFLRLVWPTTNSNNIVGRRTGHVNPYSAIEMHFGGITGWNRDPEAFCNVVAAERFPVLKVLNFFPQIFIIL